MRLENYRKGKGFLKRKNQYSKAIEAERARIDAMPDGPEKDAALAALALQIFKADRARIDAMPDGPEKDAALAELAE